MSGNCRPLAEAPQALNSVRQAIFAADVAVTAPSNRWRHCLRVPHDLAIPNPEFPTLFTDRTE